MLKRAADRTMEPAMVDGSSDPDVRAGGYPGKGLLHRFLDVPAVTLHDGAQRGKRPAQDVVRRIVPEIARAGLLLSNEPA